MTLHNSWAVHFHSVFQQKSFFVHFFSFFFKGIMPNGLLPKPGDENWLFRKKCFCKHRYLVKFSDYLFFFKLSQLSCGISCHFLGRLKIKNSNQWFKIRDLLEFFQFAKIGAFVNFIIQELKFSKLVSFWLKLTILSVLCQFHSWILTQIWVPV